MIGPWDRIEGSSHDDELDAGVEARVADPLWMLTRQWQTGELRGDDAASPISTNVRWTSRELVSYRAGAGGPVTEMPALTPLERVVEAAPSPLGGSAALHWSTQLAGQLTRRLDRSNLRNAGTALSAAFPLAAAATVALPGAGTLTVEVKRSRGFDGSAILAADEAATRAALATLAADDQDKAVGVIDDWRAKTLRRFETPAVDTWDERRLEHRFSVAAGVGADEVVLSADEFVGGHLDWYSFNVDGRAEHGLASGDENGKTVIGDVTSIPTPVRYAGMPAMRWWQFEEGDGHFGDIAADSGDLSRLLVADYATVYGNDWFSIPLRLPLGSLTQVESVNVFDTMGGLVKIPSAATLDTRKRNERAFRLYELDGDASVGAGKAPLLFLPPSLTGTDSGPAVEQVELIRDEASNLAWAIERHIEGPAGRPVDRLQHWRMAYESGDAAASAGTPPEGMWRYRLESTAPPFWIPLIPAPIPNSAQIKLRRARMQEWDLLGDDVIVGFQGELLQPGQMMLIEEEEVPRGGVTLERQWQTARWTDGSLHVWRQRSKRLGRGERSSGLRWDTLEDSN